jgi:hypothetical protein
MSRAAGTCPARSRAAEVQGARIRELPDAQAGAPAYGRRMASNDRTGRDRALTLQLELHLDREPVSGWLRTEGGAEEEFVGWLGFLDKLKRLNDAETSKEAN